MAKTPRTGLSTMDYVECLAITLCWCKYLWKTKFTGHNLNSHRLPHSPDENTQIPQHRQKPEDSHRSTNTAVAFKLICSGKGTDDMKAKLIYLL